MTCCMKECLGLLPVGEGSCLITCSMKECLGLLTVEKGSYLMTSLMKECLGLLPVEEGSCLMTCSMKECLGLQAMMAFDTRGCCTSHSGSKYACSKGSCVKIQSWFYKTQTLKDSNPVKSRLKDSNLV